MPIKPNKFSSVQILKKDRIDYKADLESLFFILYYLTNNGKTICNSLAEKKLLIDQINLSIYKERLIEKLSSKKIKYYYISLLLKVLYIIFSFIFHLSNSRFCQIMIIYLKF